MKHAGLIFALLLFAAHEARADTGDFDGEWVARSDSSFLKSFEIQNTHVLALERCATGLLSDCRFETIGVQIDSVFRFAFDSGGQRVSIVLRDLRNDRVSAEILVVLISGNRPILHRTDVYSRSFRIPLPRPGGRPRPPPPPPPPSPGPPPGPQPIIKRVMPQFPWPPPQATKRLELPVGLVTLGREETLESIYERIHGALLRASIDEWSVYAIGDSEFAVITRMEAIEPDGRPKPQPERFAIGSIALHVGGFKLNDYLHALFVAPQGHYRVIALAVINRPLGGAGPPITAETASKLLKEGEVGLSPSMQKLVLPSSGRCVAFVYEFVASKSEAPRFVTDSAVPGDRHLALAGLWDDKEFHR